MSVDRDPVILFAKPGAVRAGDKTKLSKAGVLVVEVEDPASVKLTRAYAEVDGFDLLRLACKSIGATGYNDSAKEVFGRNVAAFLAGTEVKS